MAAFSALPLKGKRILLCFKDEDTEWIADAIREYPFAERLFLFVPFLPLPSFSPVVIRCLFP